jgi:hypothetical protein
MKRKRKLELATAALVVIALTAGIAIGASSPAVVTGSVTSVTNSTANLHGTVNPEGTATNYFLEWGPTTAYGLLSPTHSAGSGITAVNVGTVATGLIPGTTYHYTVVASNRFGTSVGRDRAFTTTGHLPAVVVTGPPFEVGHAFAIVTGNINPEGEATQWAFQYGTTPNYDHQTLPAASLPASRSVQTVHTTISALAAGTIFHYRLIAVHGTTVSSYGADQLFMTQPSVRPMPNLRVSAKPHRAHSKPYLYTISGSIVPPAAFPPAWSCNGTVAVRFILRHHTRALALAAVQPNCTFSTQFLFHRLIGKSSTRLRLGIRFRGNAYVDTRSAPPQFVWLG